MKRVTALAFVGVCLTGCGGGYGNGGMNVPPYSADENGSWSGTIEFHNNGIFPTTLDLFISQNGTTMNSGDVEFNIITPGGCSGRGTLTGSVNGTNVTMTIADPGGSNIPTTTAITATSGQGTMSGTFTTSGGCDSGDQGTFSAISIPSFTSSQWSGNITPTSGAVIPLTANLSEDATGHITGTFTLTGSAAPCNTITVTGKQTGRESVMGDSQQLLIVGGVSDASNKNINNGTVGGSCVPNSFGASFSMTRP